MAYKAARALSTTLPRFVAIVLMLHVGVLAALISTSSNAATLVLGAGSMPDYLGSDDYTAVPFVLAGFSIHGVDVELEGPIARFDIVPAEGLRAGPLIGVSLGRDDSVDSNAVGELESIDAALELGAWVGFKRPVDGLPEGSLSGFVSARQVVSDDDDGAIARARLQYFFAAKRWLRFAIDIEANVADGAWISRRFDVDTNESNVSGLPSFDAKSGLRDLGVGVSTIVSFSERFALYSRLGYSQLLEDAADSPVTRIEGDSDQMFFALGLLYIRQ